MSNSTMLQVHRAFIKARLERCEERAHKMLQSAPASRVLLLLASCPATEEALATRAAVLRISGRTS